MGIPSAQLDTWSHQGATVTAQSTHISIRNALASYSWPQEVKYDVYLQGSYRNGTNIRGNSDVDLVIEITSIFWSNLSVEEKNELDFETTSYGFKDFRSEVLTALTGYYDADLIDTSGSKSIKVKAASGRLNADVVACGEYRYYRNLQLITSGMTFWTVPGNLQIINYPKLHYSNGTEKNSQEHTNGWFKTTIKIFKNAREKILLDNPNLGSFPSYFIECLLYNVPDDRFGGGQEANYVDVINWLNDAIYKEQAKTFICQNKMQYLFGSSSTQWDIFNAKLFISSLISLWNEW